MKKTSKLRRFWYVISNETWSLAVSAFTLAGFVWGASELLAWVLHSFEVTQTNLMVESTRVGSFAVALLLGFFTSTWRKFPRLEYQKKFGESGFTIRLEVGNILECSPGNDIAILSSDFFDTCVDTAIAKHSIKGQLIQTYFDGSSSKLDAALDHALSSSGATGELVEDKGFGSNRPYRYPIGTVARVSIGDRFVYLVVGATIQDTATTSATVSDCWRGLLSLWHSVATAGDKRGLSVPVWASGLGRAPGSRLALLLTVFGTFILAQGEEEGGVTTLLNIVIYDGDYSPGEFRDLQRMVEQLPL